MKKIRIPTKTVLTYAAIAAAMVFLNFALPQREPLSFALLFAAIVCRLNPFVLCAEYLAASAAALSLYATLSAAIQAAFFLVLTSVYRRFRRRMSYERALYALAAQLPFIFLFPHTGYALLPLSPILQKLILGGMITLLSLLFEGGLSALLNRAFRCRLSAGELAELTLMWLFAGMGVVFSLGSAAFYAVSLTALLFSVVLIRNAAAAPFSAVLSLPLCVAAGSAVPLAEYVIFSCAALLFCPYGKTVSALALMVVFPAAMYFEGLYRQGTIEIVFTLLACALPVILAISLPEKLFRKAKKTLLFYRERTLPRIAVNRSRRAVGEQLYEVSSLFREIESAFNLRETPDRAGQQLQAKLVASLCSGCPNRKECERSGLYDSLEKLIAVGKAKGRVNLIDLPVNLSKSCNNSAGLLFALNKQLADYSRVSLELESAREGRRLLAQQAHGVSEILRDIALEQSEEFAFSDEEQLLASAFAKEGFLSSEIFLYGEGPGFTVSLTLENEAAGKRIAEIASRALGIPLALSEKIPLTSDRACFILKRKPNFDAAFGIASRPKEGEFASGDTHSILKIDERRFIVALSDGMGSGEQAREVSDHTLTLLESFYKAKMPSETVLGTVNSLIAFSAEETFCCLDLAAVNLDTGIADVVKIGSPVGFVLSGETLQVLEGESLPMGVLEAVHPAVLRVELKTDDFLVFMSDGVTAAFGSSSELCAYLSRLHPLNPQSLAEEVLKNALERYQGKAEDDMTVLAVKLTKAA